MSALGSVLQASAFKHSSNKLFTCHTNCLQSYGKWGEGEAYMYIFETCPIIIDELTKTALENFSLSLLMILNG